VAVELVPDRCCEMPLATPQIIGPRERVAIPTDNAVSEAPHPGVAVANECVFVPRGTAKLLCDPTKAGDNVLQMKRRLMPTEHIASRTIQSSRPYHSEGRPTCTVLAK